MHFTGFSAMIFTGIGPNNMSGDRGLRVVLKTNFNLICLSAIAYYENRINIINDELVC